MFEVTTKALDLSAESYAISQLDAVYVPPPTDDDPNPEPVDPGPVKWALFPGAQLPGDLSLSGDGSIRGIPGIRGTFFVSITALHVDHVPSVVAAGDHYPPSTLKANSSPTPVRATLCLNIT